MGGSIQSKHPLFVEKHEDLQRKGDMHGYVPSMKMFNSM